MNTLQLGFVWHMHQPDYRDATGIMQMPWVFLHAIKDYYDMPWMMARHEGLKATFNITPPLIEQIRLYCDDLITHDKFLTLWIKHPSELNEGERIWMIKMCKSAPYETMIAPIEPYKSLYHHQEYNDQELLDMQIWFIIAWCGVYLRKSSSVIQEILYSAGKFNEEDKKRLLKVLEEFMATIFPYYSLLKTQGVISLSTTPLNHPILPLLIDMNNAIEAHPGTSIPEHPLSLEGDAILQISKAQELFKEIFGFDAVGFWPAEGAVDERSLELYRDAGLKWVATDEAILFKSLGSSNRDALYYPYKHNDVVIAFRDHGLSDLIGFTYRFWDPNRAADDFVTSLSKISQGGENRTVFVILDGENAWEYYHNNAFDFFDALYGKLSQADWCTLVGMDEVALNETIELPHLTPGSWIHGEFNTWVGHHEKTRGWELIYITKRDYRRHKESLNTATIEKIRHHFLAAECSDWFWWYGDDHSTDFGAEFDELFRKHLIEIYHLMQIAPPFDLYTPIISNISSADFFLKPKFEIEPQINGEHNTFFEWVGCGVVDETKIYSTMDKVRGPIQTIRFGKKAKKIFCALEGNMKQIKNSGKLHILIEPLNVHFEISPTPLCHNKLYSKEFENIVLEVGCNSWLEMSMDFTALENISEVQLRFEIEKDGRIIQTLPGYGELEINLETDYAENWFV